MQLIKLLSLLLVIIFFISCASPPQEKVPEMYWPLPPERPRIKLVDIVIGSLDAGLISGRLKRFIFGVEPDTKFIKPFGVAVSDKKMYVTEIGGIFFFDFRNGEFRIIGTTELRLPSCITVGDGKVYVGDTFRKRVYVYDLEGNALMEFGFKELDTPAGIAIDRINKRILVSDAKRHMIFVYGYDGRLITTYGRPGRGRVEFHTPYGITIDKEGRIYVVDSGNFRLQILDKDGNFLKSIGSVGTSPGNFTRPKGVALDSDGHIYVLDSAFANFQIFDYDGNILLAVGTPGRGPGEFLLPSSIWIDEYDDIYVVDQINRRIQIFKYLKERS